MVTEDENEGRVTRREFLVTALAVGFAAAVRPTAAEAVITTDTEGLIAGEVKIDGMPGYRARPAKDGAHAVVLVVEEIFGVHEHIRDVCRRLAKRGYFAVAPELFARQGDPTAITDTKRIIDEIVAKTPDSQVMADLDATVAWAGKEGADTEKLGITGFCWGGRIVWLYAARSPKLRAGVAWYGRLEGDRTSLQRQFPFDVIPQLKAPVLGLYGAADDGIPVTSVKRMQSGLKAIRSKSEIVLYPDTPHGFHADYRPSYRAREAEDGWKRMLEWFTRHSVT